MLVVFSTFVGLSQSHGLCGAVRATDYVGQQVGIAGARIAGLRKTQWESEDQANGFLHR